MHHRCHDVSTATGIPKATLHAWEARHGWPKPARLPGGERVYSDADLHDLRRVADLIRRGYRIGELVKDEQLVLPRACRCLDARHVLGRMRYNQPELEELRAAIVAGHDGRVEGLRAALACRLHPSLRPTAWRLVRIAERLRERGR